jgi:hypothetical protein
MELEGSVPHSQDPTTCPYPEQQLPVPTGQEVWSAAESIWSLGKMKSYPFLESTFTDKCKHI